MGPVRHLILLALLMLAGACSFRSAIEAVTPEADRVFALETVSRLRSGDGSWLRPRFAPELWAESEEELKAVPPLFPREAGTTEIVGYQMSTEVANGRTERSKDFTLVTHGGGRWTVTDFSTHSSGGPDRVVRWSVVPHETIPPELAMLDSMDRALPWVGAVLAILVLGLGGLIFWLVRRSRRKYDPWAGRNTGRP